jgi:diguanylate cyclase (GGDEF)-like protein/PAS domain S-box-containing protein
MDAVSHKIGRSRLPIWAGAFVALVCVSILGMSGWREWSAREASLKAAEVDVTNLARSLTQHAEDSFDLLDTSIFGVANRLEMDGTGAATLSKIQEVLIARKAAVERIHGLVVADENGKWLASSGQIGTNLSDREYFRHHLLSASKDVFIGQPVRSNTSGEWITTVSRRFNHPDGSFGGVALVTIGAKYFSEFYRQFDVGANGSIALMNGGGIVLARSPDENIAGRDLSGGAFFKSIRSGAISGVNYFQSSLDGSQRIGYYQQSSRYPLIVAVTKAQSDVLEPWRYNARMRLTFVLGLVLIIAVIGFFLVRQLRRGERLTVALASKETNFRLLAEGSSDMVTRIGLDELVQYASPSSVRVLGWLPEQLVGKPALAGVNPLDMPRVQNIVDALKQGKSEEARITYRTRHREKTEIWVESTLRITRKVSGEIDGVVAISRDVTQQKDMEGKLATLATEDGLTGLANRRRFDERLQEEWGRAYRERTSLALLMIDLDHFKAYNDNYGHPAGDKCLRAVARILADEAKRTTDLAARYGGEEFVMLLPNTDAAGCARIGERIRRELRDTGIPHVLNLPSRLVTASFGGAICWPGIERSAGHASLIEAADRALYAAKDGGRDRVVIADHASKLLPLVAAAG